MKHNLDQTCRHLHSSALSRLLLIALLALTVTLVAAPVAHAQDASVHIVQPGETLSQLAKQYGVATETLRRLNGFEDADNIGVGFPMRLPADAANTTAEEDAAQPDEEASQSVAMNIPRPERPAKVEDAVEYLVEQGDTLVSVAAKNLVSVAELVAINRVSPAQRLYAGQTLLVPKSVTLGTGERLHTVLPGQTWYGIAEKYYTTIDDLFERNDLPSWAVLRSGQELIVPPVQSFETMADLPLDEEGHHIHTRFPTDEKWIDVDLSEQRVVAYNGDEQVKAFDISAGKDDSPTVIGEFNIWIKTAVQDMYGGDRAASDYYYLKDVKWVQYFYEDYSFHGAYWHDNFGEPMSRGCINMRNEEAKWLFDWAGPEWETDGEEWQRPTEGNPGTLVIVHK